jgi:LIVCS family branched-chain amino acid:cation transporter
MKNKSSFYYIVTIGLAIFSMFFGAGNLLYPLMVGMHAGNQNFFGMLGFIITAVCLPLIGLIAMIILDCNYEVFFNRLGNRFGSFIIFLCMLVIGPLIAIPRIVTLSHTMIAPFLPLLALQDISWQSSFIFAIIFLGITYLATYRENRIVDLLGQVISPLLVISLLIIFVKGFLSAETMIAVTVQPWQAFKINFIRGYETLDLLGGIFFSSIVIHILKNTMGGSVGFNRNRLAMIGLKAGALGASLLAFVYIGMSILSMYHGHGLIPSGSLFRIIAYRILGTQGALIIGTAVLMACFSTAIALGAVVGEYLQVAIFKRSIRFPSALFLVLLLSIPLSTFGLDKVLALTAGPLIYIGYTSIIALTLCNIAYKLFDFKPVKIPVAITFIIASISYFMF